MELNKSYSPDRGAVMRQIIQEIMEEDLTGLSKGMASLG
jgi:hypothetical protein